MTTGRRRALTAFSALLALTTSLVGATPVAARGDMALGISRGTGSESVADLDAFTTLNGGVAPALWTVYSLWGSPTTKHFPTAKVEALRDRGVTAFIWWTPTWPGNWEQGKYERYKKTIKGHHDAYIRQWAEDALAFGDTVVLRYAYEPNVDFFPWGFKRFDNSARRFRKAWRHVWNIFDDVGADNVKFVLSLAKQTCSRCNLYEKFYPGDKYVDYMGFTSFNWATPRKGGWIGMMKGYAQPMKKFKQFTTKPVIVAETASNFKHGNKAKWIKTGYRKVYDRWNRIRAIVWLDAHPAGFKHPDWRLKRPNNGSAQDAYRTISAKSKFQGSLD